jgi:aromatic ring-cleaving dioxygenase
VSERRIRGFHAHVYFDAATQAQGQALCLEAAGRFKLAMGRVHSGPVGPHPDGSCQLAFAPAVFGDLVPWLAMHRHGLVVFIHPITGNDLIDHRDFAMWLGAARSLNLSVLSGSETVYDLPED